MDAHNDPCFKNKSSALSWNIVLYTFPNKAVYEISYIQMLKNNNICFLVFHSAKTVGLIDTFYTDDWSISIKSVCLHMFDWLLDWMLISRLTIGNNLNKKFQVFWVNWGKKSYSKSYSTYVIKNFNKRGGGVKPTNY